MQEREPNYHAIHSKKGVKPPVDTRLDELRAELNPPTAKKLETFAFRVVSYSGVFVILYELHNVTPWGACVVAAVFASAILWNFD